MNKVLIILLCASSSFAFGQQIEIFKKDRKRLQLEKHQVIFNVLSPGIKYEIGLFRNVSASTSLGLGLATPEEFYSVAPTFNAKARLYHNIDRRINLNKNVSGNSGNYFAISFNNYFTKWEIAGNIEDVGQGLISYGVVYGIQRAYKNGISFEVEGGSGYYRRLKGIGQGYEGIGTGLLFNFSFGWTPPKRRSKLIKWLNQEPDDEQR